MGSCHGSAVLTVQTKRVFGNLLNWDKLGEISTLFYSSTSLLHSPKDVKKDLRAIPLCCQLNCFKNNVNIACFIFSFLK